MATVIGMLMSVLGWLGAIACAGIPMWLVTTTTLGVSTWYGLWMSCILIYNQRSCGFNDFSVQEALKFKVLTIAAVVVATLGLLIGLIESCSQRKLHRCSGVTFAIAGLILAVSVTWFAILIKQGFDNPLVDLVASMFLQNDLGASLYVGWAAAALLLLGGIVLCASDNNQVMYYPQPTNPQQFLLSPSYP
uniref:Claudin n=3 Tax=Latimeria chalumnae TaxID=7897 RepID=H3A358_LATCH|nr:PREDICTED: claudin-4-like [Latimeria chalumnae]|eukprot:XP_006007842.1 PREDICTED: claudin-4-like [Latimeria chalumnae]